MMTMRALISAILLSWSAVSEAAGPRRPAAPPNGGASTPSVPRVSLPILPAQTFNSPPTPPSTGGTQPLRLSRDVARDEAAATLAAAGFPERLREHGLVVWQILRAKTRGGEKAFLTVGLPADGIPLERGSGNPERRAELDRRLEAARDFIVSEASRLLGMPEDMVSVNARLVATCCGAGCQSCLITKPEHAERWTGQKPRPTK
jgi:hypothetical protein